MTVHLGTVCQIASGTHPALYSGMHHARRLMILASLPILVGTAACDGSGTAARADDDPEAILAPRHVDSERGGQTVRSATTTPPSALAAAAGCMSDCNDEDGPGTNRATCVLNCAEAAKARPTTRPCIAGCIDGLAECMTVCDDARLETDEASCELRCRQNAGLCADDCGD